MRAIAVKQATDIFIFVCIIVNSLVLMLQWYQQPPEMVQALEVTNNILSLIFTIEFIVKVIGFGLDYFKSMWNLVDFFVCVTSWLDMILTLVSNGKNINSAVKIVRTFRVARILKLIKRFKEMQRILMTFIDAIPSLVNVGGLLFLFLYIYAVLGVYFFSTVKL
jgi:voltage-gated sodium channel type XI alpha